MPKQSNKGSEHNRVWEIKDYGNLDALVRMTSGIGGGGTGVPTDASGRTLFPEGMPDGVSTIVENGKVAPTAGVQSAAQDLLNDPKAFVDKNVDPAIAQDESLLDKGKSFLSTVFGTEDTWKDGKYLGAETPVESVWDSFLTGVKWGYDRINQVTVAGLSALPGGTKTLEWDQAGEVSVGQQLIANIGVSAGNVKRGEGNVGDVLGLFASGPLSLIGMAAPEEGTQKKGFDITKEEDRKVFEEGWEKFGSGALDTAFTIFADPLIVGGKLLKVARIKYVDRVVDEKNIVQMTKELDAGAAHFASGDLDKMAPIARFAADVVTPGANGARMPTREIMAREEIKWSSNAEGIADALNTIPANDYELSQIVIRAGLGERTAVEALVARSARAADTLANANSRLLTMRFLQDPGRQYLKSVAKLKRQSETLGKVLEEQLKKLDQGLATTAQVNAAQRQLDRVIDDIANLNDLKLRDHLDPVPGQDSMAAMAKIVDEAAIENQWFAKALSVAEDSPLTQANKGFATDTAIGRFVSKRRAKKARADYERVSTSGQGITSQDFFGANRFQRTIRIYKRAADWTPSWYVNFANPTDQGREVGAILDSLSYLGGASREVVDKATGVTKNVGGIARKDELFSMYTTSRSLGEEVSATMNRIEDAIKNDLVDFYGFDRELADALKARAMSKADLLKEEITKNPKGFFLSDDATDLKSLNVAPFLNTQLSNGQYILPWDTFETVLKNIESGKIKDWQAGSLKTKTGSVVEKMLVADNIFQDFWRPAVLFRLGYAQRNVAEGLMRGMAFSGSLDPVIQAGKAARNARSNFRRAKRADRESSKARALIEAPDAARDRFDSLSAAQIDLFDESAWLVAARGRLSSQEARLAGAAEIPVRVFNGDPASGLLISDDGAFQLQKVADEAAVVSGTPTPLAFKRSQGGIYENDLGYGIRKESSTLTNPVTMKKETISAWGISLPSGEPVRQLFDTLGEAKAWASSHAARDVSKSTAAPIERWRINQLDPADDATFIPGAGKRFDTPEEATAVLNDVIADVFSGRMQAPGPQLKLIADRGSKARTVVPKDEISPSGKMFSDAKSIQDDLDRVNAELADIKKQIDTIGPRPIPARLKGSKFQKWREQRIAAMTDEVEQSILFEKNMEQLMKDGDIVMDDVIERNLMLIRQGREMLETRLNYVEKDDMFALSEYTNQAAARRVADNGSKVYVGAVALESAFGDPRMREINWKNMSSDNTIKATIAMRTQAADSILYKMGQKQYVDVLPNAKGYWEGMESMLRQYSQSPMGQMILKGDSDDSIAAWLLSDPKGRALRDDLDNAWAAADPESAGKSARIGENLDNATDFVVQVRKGLEQITSGNKDVWKVMQSHPASAAELKAIMGNMPNLSPVVGDTTELLGFNTAMNIYRGITKAAFKQIGTKPEDAFVRGPFYAKRYTETRDQLVSNLVSQYKNVEEIPIDRILAIEKAAHIRALKDTKDFLYTIDRKTNLGKYAETMFPFIGAAQNSLTAFGRLAYRDPSVVGAIALLWQAPTKVGWEDKNGNIIIPIPHDLIPDGVEDFFGIAGMKNATINKSSLNVIMPESGFAFVPRPTPLVQAASSELMKNGLFGHYSIEAPPLLTGLFGKENGEGMWKYFKNYMYGEEGAISQEFGSLDKLLSPAANKMLQYLQKDGSSQYGYQYALQARTQDLLWRAGARSDYPKPEEIMNRTNGIFLLRMAGNMLAFTPPGYESPIQPLIEIQRAYDEKYGLEGPLKFSENFGNEMLILSSTDSTKNVGGTTSSAGTVRNIKKYEGLVREVSSSVGEDLDVLGIIVNEDLANSEYDLNAYRWMQQENIPGTTRKWREINSGGESMAESQRQAGWVEYIKFKGQLDALLQQRGLTSYSSKGAQDLNTYRKEFESNMMSNPMYEGWANDFKSTGSSKTYSAVKTITSALNDDTFMADNAESKTWQIAAEYIDTRDRLIQLVRESGVSIDNDINAGLKEQWDTFRQNSIARDIGWAGIANRYLRNDDNPEATGASFNTGGM